MLSLRVAVVTAVKTPGHPVWQARPMPDATASPTPVRAPRWSWSPPAPAAASEPPRTRCCSPCTASPCWPGRCAPSPPSPYVDHVVVVAREEDADAVRHLAARYLPEGREALLVDRRADPARLGVAGPLGAARADPGRRGRRRRGPRRGAAARRHGAVRRGGAHRRTQHGGALPARPQPGLVSGDGRRHVTGLVGVQTPQAFRAGRCSTPTPARRPTASPAPTRPAASRRTPTSRCSPSPPPPRTSRSPSPRTWRSPSGSSTADAR